MGEYEMNEENYTDVINELIDEKNLLNKLSMVMKNIQIFHFV